MRSNQSERDYDRAIAEYDAALRLFLDDFPSLYRHGLAKHRKGDAAGGHADIAAAKAISADVTESFAFLRVTDRRVEDCVS